ncbi:DUF2617 family protein [Magnetococcales bacterium HHB-1]
MELKKDNEQNPASLMSHKLIYGLSQNHWPPIPFNVLDHYIFPGAIPLNCWIIGQSHLLAFEVPQGRIFEMIAYPPETWHHNQNFTHYTLDKKEHLHLSHNALPRWKLTTDIYNHAIDKKEQKKIDHFLQHPDLFSHQFPSPNKSIIPCITALTYCADKRSVQTLHTYPEESRVVWSRTTLTI